MSTIFEWDETKAAKNLKKHGIAFEEAAHVFDDEFAINTKDRIENGEERWQTIGMVDGFLLLMVAHTVHHADVEIIRIVSARRATKREKKHYGHR